MTNIFKIDNPIRRSLYFIISALISITVIIEGQLISPSMDDLIGNIIVINIIEISITLFFSYLYWINDSKRIWDICGNKRFALAVAGCACFVNLLNDILYFIHAIDLKIGMIIFGILAVYYFIVLSMPKDFLTKYVEKLLAPKPKTEEPQEEVATQEETSSTPIEEVPNEENSEN